LKIYAVLIQWTPQTQFMAQESALSSVRLERNELAGEKAALLDKCSISESQLQNVKVCTYIVQHKKIVQHIYLEYIMCPTGSYVLKGLHPKKIWNLSPRTIPAAAVETHHLLRR